MEDLQRIRVGYISKFMIADSDFLCSIIFLHDIQPNRSDKRVVDDSKVHFQSIRDYEDIESVWRELKILFELDPSW